MLTTPNEPDIDLEITRQIEAVSAISDDNCTGCKAFQIIEDELLGYVSTLKSGHALLAKSEKQWQLAAREIIQICLPYECREWNDTNPDQHIADLSADELVKVVKELRSTHEDARIVEVQTLAVEIAKRHVAQNQVVTPVTPQIPSKPHSIVWPKLNDSTESNVITEPNIIEVQPKLQPNDKKRISMKEGLAVLDDLVTALFCQSPSLIIYDEIIDGRVDRDEMLFWLARNEYLELVMAGGAQLLFPLGQLESHLDRLKSSEFIEQIRGGVNLWHQLGRQRKELYTSILGPLCDQGFVLQARIAGKRNESEWFLGQMEGQVLVVIGNGNPPYEPMVNLSNRFSTVWLFALNAKRDDLPKIAGHTYNMEDLPVL